MKQSELIAEIVEMIEAALLEDRVVKTKALTSALLDKHKRIQGFDVPFYLLCAGEHLRDTVAAALRRYKPHPDAEEPDPQHPLIFPGYTRLQRAYLVERDGASSVVPVGLMTDRELDDKAREYLTIAAGCSEHADEIRRYQRQRHAQP